MTTKQQVINTVMYQHVPTDALLYALEMALKHLEGIEYYSQTFVCKLIEKHLRVWYAENNSPSDTYYSLMLKMDDIVYENEDTRGTASAVQELVNIFRPEDAARKKVSDAFWSLEPENRAKRVKLAKEMLSTLREIKDKELKEGIDKLEEKW